jgi:hypothetical protein
VLFFYGTLACPYCDSSSWPLLLALNATGTVTGTSYTSSNTTELYPGTPGVNLSGVQTASNYLSLDVKEGASTPPPLTAQEQSYVSNYTNGGIPFFVVGGVFLRLGSLVGPQYLSGLNPAQVYNITQHPSLNSTVYDAIHQAQLYLEAYIVVADERASVPPPTFGADQAAVLGLAAEITSPASTPPASACRGTAPIQCGNVTLAFGGDQPVFELVYDENSVNLSEQYNFSFFVPGAAELTPSGDVVAYANLIVPVPESTQISYSGNEVNLSTQWVSNVSTATGKWLPNDMYGNRTNNSVIPANNSIGTVTMNVTFHLFDVNGNDTRIKFDVGLSGWPWMHSGDELGLALDTIAAGGAHLSFNNSLQTLSQVWNSNNATLSQLVMGPSANASGGYSGPLRVSADAATFYGAHTAMMTLTFSGNGGEYSSLAYDPWVVFTLHPPGGSLGGGGGPALGPGEAEWAIVGLVALGSIALGVVLLRVRRRPVNPELSNIRSRPVTEARWLAPTYELSRAPVRPR